MVTNNELSNRLAAKIVKTMRKMEKKQFCGKCKTEQIMTKRIIGKEFCWWCPKCKDQIADSACYTSSGNSGKGTK